MARLYLLMFGLEILLVVTALISCLSAEEGDVRALPRTIWLIVILLFPIVGSVTYFAVGRPVTAAPAPGQRRPGAGFPEPTRPQRSLAPDDDPEFLRTIDRQSRDAEDARLRRWEDDLARRENELRKGQTADD